MSGTGELEVVILGCGSSGGVPRGDGDWGDCDPAEPKNRRSRCSLLVRRHGPEGVTSVLIDTSPDLRAQMLAAEVRNIDAILYTHDHVFAMRARRRIPAFMDAATRDALHGRFRYIFESVEGYPAILDAHPVPPHGQAWSLGGPGGDVPVVTFDQAHGPIRSVGYRVGPVAYSRGGARLRSLDRRRPALDAAPDPRPCRADPGLDRPGAGEAGGADQSAPRSGLQRPEGRRARQRRRRLRRLDGAAVA